MEFRKSWPYVLGGLLIVIVGVVVAWTVSKKLVSGTSSTKLAAPGVKVTATEAGVLDPSVKYENATGILKEGGIDNEGTYHLERQGGPANNVYLTSSVVDLSIFLDKNVEVWGQTLASKHAGWLMDVAKVQVVH
jgi:hypothetical protein